MREVLLLSAVIVLSSCDPDDETVLVEDVAMVVDHATVSTPPLSVYPLLRALRVGEVPWDQLPQHTCATIDSITGDTASFPVGGPVTVHFRYPDGGCADVDGRTREGVLIATFHAPLGTAPSAFSASSPGLTVTGSRVRFGITAAANGALQEVALDSCFVWLSGAWALRSSGWSTWTMTAGATTAAHTDDAYVITRTGNGSDRNGRTYSVATSDQLHFALDCPWITEGKEIVVPDGLAQRTVDHGQGLCDGYSAIVLDGDTIGLTIP